MKLTQQRLEAYLLSAAGILRGKTAGQDYKNYILSLMFYKRLCDQWECEADDAILELERQQGRAFSEKQKAVFRKRGEHRFEIPDGSRWDDVMAAHVFPLTVKLLLASEGHYALTDDDNARCLAVDVLLAATQWVEDRDDRDDDSGASWQQIISRANRNIAFDKPFEAVKKRFPDAFEDPDRDPSSAA